MAITIHDVARRAKVSVTTVSRALSEPQLVRETTLERVLAAAKHLSYRPNPAARSLITGKTGNIGIKTYANQDPVVGQFRPILGIDAWEHAYYLQYQNRKAEYFSAVWDVVNWKAAEKRLQ